MITKIKKERVIKKVRMHDTDTGSAAVQIALISESIKALTTHLKKNRKDNHSRRGLLQMVADRRTHLKYLEKKDPKVFKKLVSELDLK